MARKAWQWMAAVGLAAALSAGQAAAETRCAPAGNGLERCISGLRADTISAIAQGQRASQWCWAAVVSMLLRTYGVTVAQEQVVRQYWGAAVDMALPTAAIPGLINRTWSGAGGRAVTLTASAAAQTQLASADVLRDLDGERPLVMAVPGHAVVLVQVEYDRPVGDASAVPQIHKALVLDPAQNGALRMVKAGTAMQLTRVAAAGDGAVAVADTLLVR